MAIGAAIIFAGLAWIAWMVFLVNRQTRENESKIKTKHKIEDEEAHATLVKVMKMVQWGVISRADAMRGLEEQFPDWCAREKAKRGIAETHDSA
jgi:hypothetical protein